MEYLKATNVVLCEKSEQARKVLAALFCMGLVLFGSRNLRSVPRSLPPKPLDEESERQKLFVNCLQSLNKAARNKRNSWRAAYQGWGESCLSWIKRTREEDLDRASESTQWDLHLQAESSVADSGWRNKDIQWLAERQRWDHYYWT